ncbi:4Fe-4S binding protein [Clostridium beijerinckii]|uniref:4Fe-4S binding protein n=1 Tax=Clostridium beijerinckii TaxID=1520 RepID=UPI0030D19285
MIIDEEICIGCKACAVACPFGAIEMGTNIRMEKQSCKMFRRNYLKKSLEREGKKV